MHTPLKILLLAQKLDYPPLAFGYIKAYADQKLKNHVNIKILYLRNYTDILQNKQLSSKIGKADLIGFSCYNDLSKFTDISYHLKKQNKNLKIVIGGPMVKADPIIKPKNCFDYIVLGEGEETFLELLRHLIHDFPINKINGLAYFDKNNFIINQKRAPLSNLNLLPSPYLNNVFNLKNFTDFYLEDARGCHFSCHYCAVSHYSKKYRSFNLKRVFKELNYLLGNPASLSNIMFNDSDLLSNLSRSKKIIKQLNKYADTKKVMFSITTNFLFINNQMVESLKRSFDIACGIQSINKTALNQCNRNFNLEKIKSNIKIYGEKLLTYTYPFALSFIYGLPGDNFESFNKSINYAISASPINYFHKLLLSPNTYFDDNKKLFGIKSSKKTLSTIVSNNTYSKTDIIKTEKLLKRLDSIMILSSNDRFINHFLLKLAGLFPEKENRYLDTYKKLAKYLEQKKEFKQWAKTNSNFNINSYQQKINLKNRFELFDLILEFGKKLLKPTKTKNNFAKLKNFFESAKNRLINKTDKNYLYSINKIIKTIKKSYNRNISILNLLWSDYGNIPKSQNDEIIFITDPYVDKTFAADNPVGLIDLHTRLKTNSPNSFDIITMPFILGSIETKITKRKVMEELCRLLRPKGYLIIVDSLSSDEINLIQKKCASNSIYKILKFGIQKADFKIYIFKSGYMV